MWINLKVRLDPIYMGDGQLHMINSTSLPLSPGVRTSTAQELFSLSERVYHLVTAIQTGAAVPLVIQLRPFLSVSATCAVFHRCAGGPTLTPPPHCQSPFSN